MNKHDERRRTKTINALLKAKECLELERLYLSIQTPAPMDELFKIQSGLWSVELSLDQLTKAEEVMTG